MNLKIFAAIAIVALVGSSWRNGYSTPMLTDELDCLDNSIGK